MTGRMDGLAFHPKISQIEPVIDEHVLGLSLQRA